MKLLPLRVLVWALGALAAACSDDTSFTVTGSFGDHVDRSVTMSYYDGSAYKVATVNSIDGSFRLTGVAPSYTLVTLSDGATPLVSLIARNGDGLSADIDYAEPVNSKARGNDPTEAFNGFIRDNAEGYVKGDARALNDAVARYIADHPDSPESTALLTSVYITPGHELQADSLLRLLRPEARTRALLGTFPALLATQLEVDVSGPLSSRTLPGPGGSALRVIPRESTLTLYAFADDAQPSGSDSAAILLRDLTSMFPRKRLHGVELSSASDSLSWAVRVRNDSTALYDRSWSPMVTAERQWKSLAIPSLPFFILIDSTGNQRMRTHSAAAMRDFTVKLLSR